jgi:hypothetical protein
VPGAKRFAPRCAVLRHAVPTDPSFLSPPLLTCCLARLR